ncbi:MAG: hypothetical protein WBA93_21275 [Microcoleaceae cyanobacterium]
MSNHFQKLVFSAIGSILSYSIINISLAQATTIRDNSLSKVSPENFLAAQTTNTSLKIEQNYVIDDLVNSQTIAIEPAIVVTELINQLPENNSFEFKFVESKSQAEFVSASIGGWQNNLQKETPQPVIEPGILFGLGLISIRGLLRKKRL